LTLIYNVFFFKKKITIYKYTTLSSEIDIIILTLFKLIHFEEGMEYFQFIYLIIINKHTYSF